MHKLNYRQKTILNALSKTSHTREELENILAKKQMKTSKATLNRDLTYLEKLGHVVPRGSGKTTYYEIPEKHKIVNPIDLEKYFQSERNTYCTFNTNIFKLLDQISIFTSDELTKLDKLSRKYRNKIKQTKPDALRREIERLTIDFSWKSSEIEGNTYDLLETETLIKQGIMAEGKPKEDAIMILNHKNTIKHIYSNPEGYKTLSARKILHLHSLMVEKLHISKGLRDTAVGITGTSYEPLQDKPGIKNAMTAAIKTINNKENPFEKALLALLLISYIQPFIDGNKRTARMVATALLLAHDLYPLSFRNVDATYYKRALIIFYEINNSHNFKNMFIEQCEFAVQEYFHIN